MKKMRRIFLIVFAVAALALALVGCNETAITEHAHKWSEWSVDTATCTQGGTQTRTCTAGGCNAKDGKPATETRTTKALGHNVTSWTLCEADSSKHEGVCSRTDCGVTVTEAHNANEAGTECVDCGTALGTGEQCSHPNASATSSTDATCTSPKIEHWTCPDCVWTENRPVGSALGHDYIDVAWTPIAGGKHERACKRDCGDKQTAACNSSTVIIGTAATCIENGRENGTKCSLCGGNEKEGAVINALDHKWSEWHDNTATCTEGGTQTRHCERDGCDIDGKPATETQPVAALGHKWSEWHDSTATCTEGGEHTRTCERDGCDIDGKPATETQTTAALGHNLVVASTTAATCTAAKVNHMECSRCDYEEDQTEGEALGHNVTSWTTCEDDNSKHEGVCERADCGEKQTENCNSDGVIIGTAATCTEDGRENGTKCSKCLGNEVLGAVINALGHNYKEVAWKAVDGGTHERECANGCGDKETGTCDDDGVIIGTAATCTAAGRENGTKCSVCLGNEKEGAVIGALGHDEYKTGETTATCTANEVEHWACNRCDWTDDKEIAETALGHDYTDVVWTPASDGKHERKCTRCDYVDSEDHSATTYTYASNGEHSGTCVCGEAVIEKCELADGGNACSVCGRIVLKQNSSGSDELTHPATATSSGDKDKTYISGIVTFVLIENNSSKGGFENTSNTELRFYANNTLTITANGAKITKVEMYAANNNKPTKDNPSASVGTQSFASNIQTTTFDGDGVESVTFTTAGQTRFAKIVVYYANSKTCYHDDTVVPCEQSDATCEGTGILQDCYRCTNCGLYFTTEACTQILEGAVVNALGHDYGEWIDEVAPTCAATGTKGHFRCSNDGCGKNFDSEKAVLEDLTLEKDPANHSHLTAVAGQAATCLAAGLNAHYVCDGCGKKYATKEATEECDPTIAALGHDMAYRASGTDKHQHYCTRCDYVEEAEEHTETTKWEHGTDGHYQVCTVCLLNFNEGAHSYTDGECVCGMKDSHVHSYTGTVTKQPTCTEKGETTYTCDGCSHTYTEDIDAHGHDEYKASETAATCTANKVEHWACHSCDDWTEEKEIAETALGHDFTGTTVLPIDGDAMHHATKCSRCNVLDVANKVECDYTEETVDADGHRTTCVCGRTGSTTPHEYAAATQTCSCGKINPTYLVFVRNPEIVATFEMGETTNKTDGSSQSSYTETVGSYTLTITKTSGNIYTNAGDGTNSVLKVGTASGAAKFSFTVPNDIGAVVIYVAHYNATKPATFTINNESVDAPTGSEYKPIRVDTSSVKVIVFEASKYCYIDKIVYYCVAENYSADESTARVISAANCTDNGEITFKCTTTGCEKTHSIAIPALGHTYGEWIDEVAPTCTTTGIKGHYHCGVCDKDLDSEENGYAVLEDLTIAIDPNNHAGDLTHVDAKEATTCDVTDTENAGHAEYWQCACGVMYADGSRNTVIDSLEFSYLDHTPDWTTKTDSGHSGGCSVCRANIAEQPHDWNDADKCSICGYDKPAGKHFVTTVIIVDGVRVEGIPAGVTLTWNPADTNGAFDEGEEVTLEVGLIGYNLVSVVVTDSTGNVPEDWDVDNGYCMGYMNDDYTVTVTIVSIPTAEVNYSVENATVIVTYGDGTTIGSGGRVPVGTELTITVTADEGYEVKSVTVNGVAVENGKYTVKETDTTITIAATIEEKAVPVTVTMTTFSETSGSLVDTATSKTDANITYLAEKGTGTSEPATNSGEIRVYQGGGLFTVSAANDKKIKKIIIGSSMVTTLDYSVDGGTAVTGQAVAANGTLEITDLNATTIQFTCRGTTKTTRLYVNYIQVVYE